MFGQLLNIAGGWLAGAVAKRFGASERTGPLPGHKVGSPIAAVIGAAVVGVGRHFITGEPIDANQILAAGIGGGGGAIAIHATTKNGAEFARVAWAHYQERRRR